MRFIQRIALALSVLALLVTPSWGQHNVRVATYNIQYLNAKISKGRADQIKSIIAKLDADVIGLQEIDDRAALERVFPKDEWQLVIDDESGENQDLAVAVRKPFKVINLKGDPTNGLNADDGDFLYPEKSLKLEFPDRRDVLVVEVEIPNSKGQSFFVMVHHAKSRLTGRNNTEQRRVAASRLILKALEARFDEKDFVLLGDFNDNGDDRSLNILETGDPDAHAAMEETDGPFLINLCEQLLKENRVSHGRRATDIIGGKVNTVDPPSRKRNFDLLGTDTHTGDILFENLLIPMHMKTRSAGAAKILDDPVGVLGGANRASDHLPLYADFFFHDKGADDGAPMGEGIRIVAALPNPDGADEGREWVEVKNATKADVKLAGWRLRDRGSNVFNLTGTLAAGKVERFMLPAGVMPLNNSGDDVSLIDATGTVRHRVSYLASQAKSEAVVKFE